MFRENIGAINHKYHDLKHIVSALKNETDSCRKKQLLTDLENDIMIYNSHMNTGNDVLDALLSDAWINCCNKNIQWTCMADGSALKFMDAIDLYVLLGNILDNAVESASMVSKEQKRLLSVNIWKRERMAFLKIKNYCEKMPVFQKGIPVSTKENSSEHGYGMKSIKAIVERYNGEWKISAENNIFTLDIFLPIPMDFD